MLTSNLLILKSRPFPLKVTPSSYFQGRTFSLLLSNSAGAQRVPVDEPERQPESPAASSAGPSVLPAVLPPDVQGVHPQPAQSEGPGPAESGPGPLPVPPVTRGPRGHPAAPRSGLQQRLPGDGRRRGAGGGRRQRGHSKLQRSATEFGQKVRRRGKRPIGTERSRASKHQAADFPHNVRSPEEIKARKAANV